MSAAPARKAKIDEVVIPDYCNVGIIFRALFGVNAVILCAVLLNANGLMNGMLDFVEASMVVEWACLMSLFSLCGLRQLLLRTGWSRLWSPYLQRATCALVPAAVTGYVIHFFSSFEWFLSRFPNLTLFEGMLTAGLFGLALQHYFELRMRAFSPALAEARLQGLQARIRPHFLFNSLNAVLSLIRKEPLRAEEAIEDMAELFRVFMRDARDMTTLEEEIHLCKQYLSIEKIRLGDRLQVEWDTADIPDAVLKKAQISSLMLQPLLENAVNYGVEPARAPSLIRVKISLTLDRIEIAVVNPDLDLSPRDAFLAGRNRMALDNIRERLQLLYDVEAQLASGKIDGFHEVRLRFPYIQART
jgi:two-component system sensor histidine kinase AlgZ